MLEGIELCGLEMDSMTKSFNVQMRMEITKPRSGCRIGREAGHLLVPFRLERMEIGGGGVSSFLWHLFFKGCLLIHRLQEWDQVAEMRWTCKPVSGETQRPSSWNERPWERSEGSADNRNLQSTRLVCI